jgi:hypothetical protein
MTHVFSVLCFWNSYFYAQIFLWFSFIFMCCLFFIVFIFKFLSTTSFVCLFVSPLSYSFKYYNFHSWMYWFFVSWVAIHQNHLFIFFCIFLYFKYATYDILKSLIFLIFVFPWVDFIFYFLDYVSLDYCS